MRKLLILAGAVVALGGLALADVDRGTGDPAEASLDVTVTWSAAEWIILYIPSTDMSVNLGEIGPGRYDPETGTWTPLESGNHRVVVVTNAPGGFQLQISAAVASVPAGHPNPTGILSRLTLTSAALGLTDASLDTTRSYSGPRGLFMANDIQYQFTPSFDDVPGSYSVTITYTATSQ